LTSYNFCMYIVSSCLSKVTGLLCLALRKAWYHTVHVLAGVYMY